ncbi:protein-S-isoprenylcysteine carboxyl O-methyltransferase KNAG_0C04460 [Huiozyma naganishii CBS 8797]|uniref:Protein-S-isoprenylcysteine O-methyltransferase n=1 Tax=Huiozyma naganishii (strain ATCC MYA-139 / BCRC 22969 / CBS 8797 / KCTC 17520 / NBRC 10181 / NCYC 3082 / Yp74L-3) TaxID=1071383 RepID=J7RJ57_HUIN7|nr:hypothetical protein KNAG_0C04460 [Kazachstania naganishii CBS 8797]CCK69548.1 hypothetical protein KNAG_0C04460 [Kazachstania naganishii CBS 8797]
MEEDRKEVNSELPDITLNPPHEIAKISFGLGILLGCSLGFLFTLQFKSFNIYIISLATFHFLEYYVTAKYNPKKVHADSFLLKNGIEYIGAHTFASLECLMEYWICPNLKTGHSPLRKIIFVVGLLMVVLGQLVRSISMRQAGRSFSHVVKVEKENDHKLVQDGLYSVFRHPSYFGFFWWALGTQLILFNPISLILFCFVLWRFFNKRIKFEERHLIEFFGSSYIQYKKNVKVWIPFIM